MLFNYRLCNICNIFTYNYIIFNNKLYCNSCYKKNNLYEKKYCYYCNELLNNSSSWYYYNSNHYCSRKCRRNHLKLY